MYQTINDKYSTLQDTIALNNSKFETSDNYSIHDSIDMSSFNN